MKKTILAFATGATAFISSPASAATDFSGSTLNFSYRFPTFATVYSSADYLVGPGVEVLDVAGDPAVTLDISGNTLLVNFFRTATWSNFAFNGWILSDQMNSVDDITGVTINPATNLASFNSSNIVFTADSITVNWAGLSWDPTTSLLLDVTFGSGVPEPSTWGMMLLGFGGVGYSMRRRRRATPFVQVA